MLGSLSELEPQLEKHYIYTSAQSFGPSLTPEHRMLGPWPSFQGPTPVILPLISPLRALPALKRQLPFGEVSPAHVAPITQSRTGPDGLIIPSVPPFSFPTPQPPPLNNTLGLIQAWPSPLRPVDLPAATLPQFLSLAIVNSANARETCGLLLGLLVDSALRITTLMIPDQDCTRSSCTIADQEQVSAFEEHRALTTLGWVSAVYRIA